MTVSPFHRRWHLTSNDRYSSGMLSNVLVRRALSEEIDLIHVMVQAIANETFAELFPSGVPIGEANWSSAWVAVSGEEIRCDYDARPMGKRFVGST